ncbi:innate immunity activator b isoform X2 [Sardina pilchardus]|uniref:innate immunity activator b isoform X2 n=1 Tax=Sardina pilchardus TaxID=27697 RepID=UPI002E1231CE
MEAKEETSDTDSGIILHSGPDSPCTVMKDVTTHTRAVRLKLQSLEEHLEACVLELKRLCIREAELMGHLSPDYPLLPGEEPPQVRRRIGATFKLDDQSLLEKPSALSAVEAELGLQQQIVVAARRLVQEGAPSKAVRRSRQQQSRHQEKKLQQLQEQVFQLRLQHGRTSPHPAMAAQREERANQEPSPPESGPLSGSTPHRQEQRHTHTHSHTHTPPQTLNLRTSLSHHTQLSPSLSHTHNHLPSPTRSPSLNHSHTILSPSLSHSHVSLSPSLNHSHVTLSPSLFHTHILPSPIPSPSPSPNPSHRTLSPASSLSLSVGGVEEDERPPIENSPWTESSLDQPYEKSKKHRSSSRRSTSPAVTPTLPPLEVCVGGDSSRPLPLPSHVRPAQSNSAPCTPEMQLRRGLSLRLPSSGYDVDQDRGRARFPRRRLTDVGMSPEYPPLQVGVGNPLHHSSSEDSASEHSGISHASSSHASADAPADPTRLTSPAYGHPDPYANPPNARYAHSPTDPYANARYAQPPTDPYANPPNGRYAQPPTDPYANAHYAHSPSDPYANGRYAQPPTDPYANPPNARYAQPPSDPYANPPNGRYAHSPTDPYANGRYAHSPSDPYANAPNSFYRNPQHQSAGTFSGRHDYWYEDAPVALAVPGHVRLSRAPSLREYPPCHPAHGLPRQLVSEQLKSWHQRQQLQRPARPRSLDRHRQGAMRIRSTHTHTHAHTHTHTHTHAHAAGRDSPLTLQPRRMDQPPQAVPRVPRVEQNCAQWTTEDDAHIISQV